MLKVADRAREVVDRTRKVVDRAEKVEDTVRIGGKNAESDG